MSRPAETREISSGSLCTNRLPLLEPPPSNGTMVVACPSWVPLLTISRPASIHTGAAASYQVWPKREPETLKFSCSPERMPTRSPAMA